MPFAGVYHRETMRLKIASAIALTSFSTALVVSTVCSTNAQTPSPGITLTVSPTIGAHSVTIEGIAPSGQPLEAALYVRFSKDLPTVLLSRYGIVTGADGRYNATLPLAPAFFSDAIVTVILQSLPTGPRTSASLSIGAPNIAAPPDEIPPWAR